MPEPFMQTDVIGLCPPGVGANKVEPVETFPGARAEAILAEIRTMSAAHRDSIAGALLRDAVKRAPPLPASEQGGQSIDIGHGDPRTIMVDSILADVATLSAQDRQVVRLRLNMAAYGAADFDTTGLRAKAEAHKASQAEGMETLGLYAWGARLNPTVRALLEASVDVIRDEAAPGT